MNIYSAKKRTIDNIKFDSIFESKIYNELKLLARAGKIKNLEMQPRFLINSGDTFDCNFTKSKKTKISDSYYSPDFKYEDLNNNIIVVEAKGVKTEAYQLRKKLFLMNAKKNNICDQFHEITKKETKIYYVRTAK